jgi:hypothetical protein
MPRRRLLTHAAYTVFLVVAVLGLVFAMFGLPISRVQVDGIIAQSKYCKADSQCVVASLACPLHAEVVNIAELHKVQDAADRYTRYWGSCVYGAMDLHDYGHIRCQSGTCMAPLKSEFSSQINTGR